MQGINPNSHMTEADLQLSRRLAGKEKTAWDNFASKTKNLDKKSADKKHRMRSALNRLCDSKLNNFFSLTMEQIEEFKEPDTQNTTKNTRRGDVSQLRILIQSHLNYIEEPEVRNWAEQPSSALINKSDSKVQFPFLDERNRKLAETYAGYAYKNESSIYATKMTLRSLDNYIQGKFFADRELDLDNELNLGNDAQAKKEKSRLKGAFSRLQSWLKTERGMEVWRYWRKYKFSNALTTLKY